MDFLEALAGLGVIAVIRADTPQEAVRISKAVLDGGMRCIEITFTTPEAEKAIEELRAIDDAVVGAGSLRTPEQVELAWKAGARFGVSPHYDPEVQVMAQCDRIDMPYLPGAITPTEIVQCWDAGSTAVKLFPGSLGGPQYLKAIRGPLPDIPIVPTGGVSVDNMHEWFDAGAWAVGMGGNLAVGTSEQITKTAHAVQSAFERIRDGSPTGADAS